MITSPCKKYTSMVRYAKMLCTVVLFDGHASNTMTQFTQYSRWILSLHSVSLDVRVMLMAKMLKGLNRPLN